MALPEQLVEAISARVHEAWVEAKRGHGVASRQSQAGEELMVAYDQLSEAAKELDRAPVRAVLSAVEAAGAVIVERATPATEDPREAVWAKYPNDAREILADAAATRCTSHKCQAPVWRGVTAAKGVPTVFDIKPNGERTRTNHFRTCLDRDRFVSPKR